jgi:hypothetical protein
MKIKQIITLLIVITISSTARSQTAAIDYMDKISDQFKSIMSDTWDYVSAASHGKNARKIENRRIDLVKTIADAQKTINKMQDFEGDASYRDTVLSYLQLSYNVLNKDFAKIVDMEDIAEQSYDNMEAYLLAEQMADEKLDKANDNLTQEEEKFAGAHGITLTENKTKVAKKLETSSAVIKYYNVVYLIFFKSYKQEVYLINAMNTSDVNGMEQNKNALITCSANGLKSLDTVKSFKGDASLVTSAKALLNFYKMESSTKMKEVIDYFMAKEKFDKIKAAYDAKDESSRTQADVDQYNKAINELNASTKKFSTLNDDLNKKRSTAIDNWNNTATKFMDTHVPKYKQ